MNMCDETITVFNAQFNPEKDLDEYHGTVISGVSWFGDIAAVVDPSTGLKAASKVTIRVPKNADFSGKAYVDPLSYQTADPTSCFTLKSGSVIVKGAVSIDNPTPAMLHKQFTDAITVLGVTDNRRAPNAPHWKVVGT